MREFLLTLLAIATLIYGTEFMYKRYLFNDNCTNTKECITASIIYIVIVIISLVFLNSVFN